MSDSSIHDSREMHVEISALIGGIAKAFDLDESETISALETGKVTMTFQSDTNGNPYALATYNQKSARL